MLDSVHGIQHLFYFFFSYNNEKDQQTKVHTTQNRNKKRKTPQIEIILTKIGYIMDNNTFLYIRIMQMKHPTLPHRIFL